MFDRPAMWLRLGATFLVVSVVAALLQPNGETVYGNRTVFILDAWVERTAFWLGILFVGGYILDRVFARHQDR